VHDRIDILFETARFNLSEVKEHFINDCCFGEDLAAWLRGRLNSNGMRALEPYQEDWGWEFSVKDSVGSYYVGVGGNAAAGAANKNQGEWRVMISKRRSLWDRLTGKNKLSAGEPIISSIRTVLEAETDFANFREE
jgi:hypothetical protein